MFMIMFNSAWFPRRIKRAIRDLPLGTHNPIFLQFHRPCATLTMITETSSPTNTQYIYVTHITIIHKTQSSIPDGFMEKDSLTLSVLLFLSVSTHLYTSNAQHTNMHMHTDQLQNAPKRTRARLQIDNSPTRATYSEDDEDVVLVR